MLDRWSFDGTLDRLNSRKGGRVKVYDEVVDKIGDLVIDLGKTAVIAGFAGLFVENIIHPVISSATIFVGLALICTGLYAFQVKNRRQAGARKSKN